MRKLNIDNPFFEFMGKLGDMFCLNIIYLATCVPLITIGAASTAIYRVMMRKARGDCAYPVREYLTAFKEDWKKSTKIWLIFLVSGGVLIFDLMYIGKTWNVWGVGVGILLCVWIILVSYVFPLTARFDNTIGNTIKNAGYMAIRHFPYTILIVFLNLLPIISFLIGGVLFAMMAPIFLVIGVSLIIRANASLFGKIFDRYIDKAPDARQCEVEENERERNI